MSVFEAYSYLFFDSMMGMFLVPPHHAFVFDMMLMFGFYNKIAMVIFSSLGALLGVMLDWILGKLIRTIQSPAGLIEDYIHYNRINKVIRLCWPLLLLLSFLPSWWSFTYIPIAGFVIVSMGIYKISLKNILLVYAPMVVLHQILVVMMYK
jgi:membrane protein YqaA with SNARE-associated domain